MNYGRLHRCRSFSSCTLSSETFSLNNEYDSINELGFVIFPQAASTNE